MPRKTIAAIFILLMTFAAPSAHAQDGSPFILPLTEAPGPKTWLVGQFYGNTVDAYTYRQQWYSAGQGIHFGLDFFAPCGTPVVAVADGTIHAVDAPSFGSDPHNVVLIHPQTGFSSVYGHLLQTSLLVEGQPIQQGDLVGYVGDPDGVCTSRPHLHFELRSLDFRSVFNPIDYINAPWQTLASIGPLTTPQFQRDLANPLQWMVIRDQPSVSFGGPYLNNYARSLPPEGSATPPDGAPLARPSLPLEPGSMWRAVQLTQDGCCPLAWWHPTDSSRFFTLEPGGIVARDVSGNADLAGEYRVERLSPDGTFRTFRADGGVLVEDVSTQTRWPVQTDGVLPAISADNSRLLWQVADFLLVPGDDYPTVEIFTSSIDGSGQQRIWQQVGGSALWLDASRVLIVSPMLDSAETTLTVFDTSSRQSYTLGTWDWLRSLSVGPGGERLMFYLIWQDDLAQNGVYSISTQPGAAPARLPWFGSWRWRDAHSVYYLPFFIGWYNADKQIIAYYDIAAGTGHYLTDINTMPITINSGDWSVSPDGTRILFRSAADNALWLLDDTANLP